METTQQTARTTAAFVLFLGAMAVPTLGLADHMSPAPVLGNLTIELELVADGVNPVLVHPLSVKHAGDGSGRLFIVDQTGKIFVVAADGEVLTTPFLDLTNPALSPRDQIPPQTGNDERGVLGMAFHPDYENNGRFFVRHAVPRPGTSSDDCWDGSRGCHRERVAEFAVSGDPNVADPLPTAVLFEVDQPESNHNGGDIEFGPDGYLYFAFGDGGGSNDRLNRDYLPHGEIGNGQSIAGPLAAPHTAALGAMLRIDVDSFDPFNPDGRVPYGIPADNPFVSPDGNSRESLEMDEIWAYGFRNPWRFSFDRENGRLFLADVGQGNFEEVNIVERGGNYGWVIKEGYHCFDFNDSSVPLPDCPDVGLRGDPLIDPITEYDHGDGISIGGGYVYRGSQSPLLVGKYLFGDLSRNGSLPDGRLFHIDSDGTSPIPIIEFRIKGREVLGEFVLGFGEGEDGEVYLGSTAIRTLPTFKEVGKVYRIVQSFDSDDDGVPDVSDNCSQVANPDQRDTDGDGIGNYCDPDLTNDGWVNFEDLGLLKAVYLSGDPDADFDGDGVVNTVDIGILKSFFLGHPGPGIVE